MFIYWLKGLFNWFWFICCSFGGEVIWAVAVTLIYSWASDGLEDCGSGFWIGGSYGFEIVGDDSASAGVSRAWDSFSSYFGEACFTDAIASDLSFKAFFSGLFLDLGFLGVDSFFLGCWNCLSTPSPFLPPSGSESSSFSCSSKEKRSFLVSIP